MTFFEHKEFFWLFLLIPMLLGFFVLSRLRQKKSLQKFGDLPLISALMPLRSVNRPWLKFLISLLAVSALIMALVNPMIGSRLQEAKHEGVDIIIALDVSRSMLAEDIQPNRLERAKLAVSRLTDRLEQDRIGLVIFAGQAIHQVPLTSDKHALRMILRTINHNSVSIQGTAIGAAIDRARISLQHEEGKSKFIIIISDGENHMDDPLEASRQAMSEGITIHTIGLGSPEGAPIPVYRNAQLSGFLRDQNGNTVISRYDRTTLEKIAQTTGGLFRHGSGADLGLNAILEDIRAAEQDTFETLVFAEYESRYYYFVAMALILLLAEMLLANRKNKWMDKIRLFHSK